MTDSRSGIGKGLSSCPFPGCNWRIGCFRLDDLRRTIEDGGGHALTIPCDVTNRNDVMDAVRQTEEAFGRPIDIVVNNAGVMHYTFMKNVHYDEWKQEIDVNVTVGALIFPLSNTINWFSFRAQ